MKFSRLKNGKTKWIIFIVAAISMSMIQTAFCQSDLTLMIQKSPVNGGTVTPEAGIHSFGETQEVTLTAVPKPGYYFVYWIGDVVDPTSSRTTATITSPKIIIAVFERDEFEFVADVEHQQGWMGFSRLIPYSPLRISSGFGGGGGQRNGGRGGFIINGEEPEPEPESDEFPVPTPEPATIILMGLGSLIVMKQHKKSINTKR